MKYTNYKFYVYIFVFPLLISNLLGQSMQELQKLKAEYEEFQKEQKDLLLPNERDKIIDPDTGLPVSSQISPYKLEMDYRDSLDVGLKHFGYDLFISRDTVKFWDNLPAPSSYLLGPGDEIIIALWGETQIRQAYKISRYGEIYDEKVGVLNLTGRTVDQSKEYLINQFGRVYATLKGSNPSTFLDISLGELRSINVHFVGEVNYPGVYPLHPFSSVITGLIQAGGIDTTGTLRNIQVKRDGKEHLTFDLYDYLLYGIIPNNIQLRDQDIIVVPIRMSTVVIDSSVYRPGIYESKLDETIKQMINYAGGIKPNASSSIGLKRIIPLDKRKQFTPSLENYYIDYFKSQLIKVQNGDEIIVRSNFKSTNQVEIIGQVKNPGIYHYYPGMLLSDLIALGGGFLDSTFIKSIYKNKAEIIRRDPNSRYEKVIPVNLNNIISGINYVDIKLQNLDRFVVHANLNFFEKKNVQILGEVNVPGSYPLISDNETLQSVISRAGDLTSKALDNGISIYRDIKYFEIIENEGKKTNNTIKSIKSMKTTKEIKTIGKDRKNNKKDKVRVAWENESIALMPGDSVIVKESTGTVNVSGEVYNPGLIEFTKGKSLRHYLNAAGGLTNRGSSNGIIVIYANGVVSPKKWYSSPNIEDGSTIIVNEKELQPPFSIADFATTSLSIISTTVTILVLSQQLNTN